MKKKIAVLPGDGIGPEVVDQAIKVLDAVADRFGHYFEYCFGDIGAVAIDNFGVPLPEVTLEACINADAILMGAIGHPRFDNDPSAPVRPEQGLLALRKKLGLFANIRPVTTYKSLAHLSPLRPERIKNLDFVIYRELTGGIYFGDKSRTEDRKAAIDTCTYSYEEIERISRLAFEQAMLRRKKVTLVDKANVLETSRLWRECVQEIGKDYPEVELDYLFVDNAAMQMILNPAQFDVLLTSNMFGDILSDEASVLTGSLGLLPSASIGKSCALFEPVHGSYPQATGEDIANPIATILSGAMLLDELAFHEEATCIRNAVRMVLEKGLGTPDLKATVYCGCDQMGDILASIVSDEEELGDIHQDKIKEGASTII